MFHRGRRRHDSAPRCQPARPTRARPQTLSLQAGWRSNHVAGPGPRSVWSPAIPRASTGGARTAACSDPGNPFLCAFTSGGGRRHCRSKTATGDSFVPLQKAEPLASSDQPQDWRSRTFRQFQIRWYEQLGVPDFPEPPAAPSREHLPTRPVPWRASSRELFVGECCCVRWDRLSTANVNRSGRPVRRLVHMRLRSRRPTLGQRPSRNHDHHVPQQRLLERLPGISVGTKTSCQKGPGGDVPLKGAGVRRRIRWLS